MQNIKIAKIIDALYPHEQVNPTANSPLSIRETASQVIRLAGRVGLLMLFFLAVEWWLMRVAKLPAESYHHPLLFLEILRQIDWLGWLTALAALLFFAIRKKNIFLQKWESIPSGKEIRLLVLLSAFLMTWAFSAYNYNFYFEQSHLFDRLLLISLAALIYWRPIFIFPFVMQLIAIVWQFNYPIGGYSVAEQLLFIRILILAGTSFVLFYLTEKDNLNDFVFLLCCLLAASYWISGINKNPPIWLKEDNIAFLLPAMYANGWLAFLPADSVSELTRVLSVLNWPIKIFTVMVEVGVMFLLWRYTTVLFFLACWIVFHLGIFIFSGIFFWKWILLHIFLFWLFKSRWNPQQVPIFSRPHFVLSLIVITGSSIWFSLSPLAWFDSPVSYSYRFEAIGESGKSQTFSAKSFAPYDYQFTLGNFLYLSEQPNLSIVSGATNRETATALSQIESPEEFFKVEADMGHVRFNPRLARVFEEFIQRFAASQNVEVRGTNWWRFLQPPPWLWTISRGTDAKRREPIEQIKITQVTSYFDGHDYREIRRTPLRVIEIRAGEDTSSKTVENQEWTHAY